jgi:hypothetical protein
MFASTCSSFGLVLGLLSVASAIPTSAGLAPGCQSTIAPDILLPLSEADPSVVGNFTNQFVVSQSVDANGTVVNQVNTVVVFQNLTAGATGCQLGVTFPQNYPIISCGVPTLNIYTVCNGVSDEVCYPSSWSAMYPTTTPATWLGQNLFGTVTMIPGTTQIINSESCENFGKLAFVVSIADSVTEAAAVQFTDTTDWVSGPGLAGFFMTFNNC